MISAILSVKRPIRPDATGISTYSRFFKSAGNRPSTPSSGTMRKRADTFNPARTIGPYINRARKADIILNRNNERITPEITLKSRGMRRENGMSFSFPNFARSPGLPRIIEIY